MKNYGERIRKARKLKKMTMKQLAEKIGTVESNVSMYEREERLPPVDKIEAMAKVLGVSPNYITGWEPIEIVAKQDGDALVLSEELDTINDLIFSSIIRDPSVIVTMSRKMNGGLTITLDTKNMTCTFTGKEKEETLSISKEQMNNLISAFHTDDDEKIEDVVSSIWNYGGTMK